MPRNGTKNLKPMSQRSKEEVKKISSKGGKRSGEVRRARKTLREELLAMLSVGDTQNQMTLALLEKAKDGDTKAFEVVRDTIGEKPVDKVMVAEVDQNIINEVEAMISDEEE
jgi:hypothetical protein